MILALGTGMRSGEIFNLKWADIDLRERIIILQNTKNNEKRIIPINDMVYRSLTQLQPKPGCSFVFSRRDGKPYRSIRYHFERAVKKAGLTDFRLHDCRHTFASHLVMNSVPIFEVSKLLGHKTLAMTLRYSHLSNRNLRQAVDKLDFTDNSSEIDRTSTAHSDEGNAKNE